MPNVKKLRINGSQVDVDAEEERSLLELLREDLGLTGAKYGCGEGRCGACTVLVDGAPVRSCVTTCRTVRSSRDHHDRGPRTRWQVASSSGRVPRRQAPCSAAIARAG